MATTAIGDFFLVEASNDSEVERLVADFEADLSDSTATTPPSSPPPELEDEPATPTTPLPGPTSDITWLLELPASSSEPFTVPNTSYEIDAIRDLLIRYTPALLESMSEQTLKGLLGKVKQLSSAGPDAEHLARDFIAQVEGYLARASK